MDAFIFMNGSTINPARIYRAPLNKYTLPNCPATRCATKAEPQMIEMTKRVRSAFRRMKECIL